MQKVLKCNDLSLIEYIKNYLIGQGITAVEVQTNDNVHYLLSEAPLMIIAPLVQDSLKDENILRLKDGNGLSLYCEGPLERELLLPFAYDTPGPRPFDEQQYQGEENITICGEIIKYNKKTGEYSLPANIIGSSEYYEICSNLLKTSPSIHFKTFEYGFGSAIESISSQDQVHIFDDALPKELKILEAAYKNSSDKVNAFVHLDLDGIIEMYNKMREDRPRESYIIEAYFAQMLSRALNRALNIGEDGNVKFSLHGLQEQIKGIDRQVAFHIILTKNQLGPSIIGHQAIYGIFGSRFFSQLQNIINVYTDFSISKIKNITTLNHVVHVQKSAWELGELTAVASANIFDVDFTYKKFDVPIVIVHQDSQYILYTPASCKEAAESYLSTLQNITIINHSLK